jgi:hypothetical protein
MDFKRTKQRGIRQEAMKVWYSPCGQYRVSWVAEVEGVSVIPHYFACVRCYANAYEDRELWDFAGKRGTYRVMKAAVEACEKHERLWKFAIETSETERNGRNDRLRAIKDRAKVGVGVHCNSAMNSMPVWVRPLANTVLLNQLFPQPRQRYAETEDDDDDVGSPTTVAALIDGIDAAFLAATDLTLNADDSSDDEQDDDEEEKPTVKPTPAAKPAAVTAVSAPVVATKKPAAKAVKKPAKKAAAKKPAKKKAKSK